jgi:protein tyrosine/serine phosphatase
MSEPKLFRNVDEHVFRSSKPATKTHLDSLQKRGVGGIISLDPLPRKLLSHAQKRGMKIIEIPITEDAPPTDEEMSKAFDFILGQKERGKKVLIHCHGGRQRTSLMALNYLVANGEHPLRAWQKQDYGAYQEHKEYLAKNKEHLKRLLNSRKKRRK